MQRDYNIRGLRKTDPRSQSQSNALSVGSIIILLHHLNLPLGHYITATSDRPTKYGCHLTQITCPHLQLQYKTYNLQDPASPSKILKMLLRGARILIKQQPLRRWKHTGVEHVKLESFELFTPISSHQEDLLPFNRKRHSELFGQLVRSDVTKQTEEINDLPNDYVRRPEDPIISNFRNPDGSFIRGNSAEEARLHPLTLEGRVDHSVVKLPSTISKAIDEKILSLRIPSQLKERAAEIYQSLDKDQIQKAPVSALDSDAHIAALFLQDYANVKKVLLELKKRVGEDKFSPESVLDIGYGPATGMIALNEIMGERFKPSVKDAYVIGRRNNEMKKRAKLLLSQQPCEAIEEPKEKTNMEDKPEEDDLLGRIDTRKINIQTHVRDSLASTKRYDLIIINQALLTREHSFPRDIDLNLDMVLPLLNPNGHLVLVERGNPLGFEIIARARQVMLRPENYVNERGKIPRPYIRGSKLKPQKLRDDDKIVTEEHKAYEQKMIEQLEQEIAEDANLEDHLTAKFGELSEDDLKFEFEDEVELIDPKNESANETPNYSGVDYHLSIIAPCPHHGRCPLQLGDPYLYKVRDHKHRFSHCSFSNVVERPKYTLELKKGKKLAMLWEKEKLLKGERKMFQGNGRPGGNNTELGDFSYLIMHRAPNDEASIKKIESDREHATSVEEDKSSWPRLVDYPTKIKKNVKFNVCAPSGNIETWQVPKSLGKQTYHDARKARQGDLWALGKKTVVLKERFSEEGLARLKLMAKSQRKVVLREKRRKEWKKVEVKDPAHFDETFEPDALNEAYAAKFESTKKYRQKTKKLGLSQ